MSLTLSAPTIIIMDIKMVIHKLKPITIFTIQGGSQSRKMVLYCKRTVNIMMIDTMDNRMAATPAITEPVRNDWQLQQLWKIGFAIFSCLIFFKFPA